MMRHLLTTSAAALALVAGGMATADAKTCVSVSGVSTATHGRPYTVTAKGGTDTAGMTMRLCVMKVESNRHLRPQSCRTVGSGSVTAHPTERQAGRYTYVAAAYALKGGRLLSTSKPITVTVR